MTSIRVTASRLMTAKEVKRQTINLKTDMDQLQRMLDLQVQIRNYIEGKQQEKADRAATLTAM